LDIILFGKIEALIKSAGAMSNASAMLKNTSKENGWAIPGASMALMCERLTWASSASFSWEYPLILRSVDIAIPIVKIDNVLKKENDGWK